MRISSLAVKFLAVFASVLTVLVFVPISSQAAPCVAETVLYSGNTASEIRDLDLEGVLYDITFVYDTGNNVYGPKGQGDFLFDATNAEEENLSKHQC
jgi:hypothetical protein